MLIFPHMEAFSTNFRANFPLQQSELVIFGWNLCQPQRREGNNKKPTTWAPFKPSTRISVSRMKTFWRYFQISAWKFLGKSTSNHLQCGRDGKTGQWGKHSIPDSLLLPSDSRFYWETSPKPHNTCPHLKCHCGLVGCWVFFFPSFAF